MTKKELEKEAEEYALANRSMCVEGDNADLLKEVFLDVAEPREKQIQIDAEQIRALQKQNGELTDKVKGLEQQIEKMKRCEICDEYTSGSCNYHSYSQQVCKENGMKLFKLKEIKEK